MKNLIYLLMSFLILSCTASGKKMIYEENFDNNEISSEYWNFDLGNGCPDLCGWGNNERQFYTRENARVENGNLIITTTLEDSTYYSSKLTTKGKLEFQYATVEVRAKLPKGTGIWPAIWLLGNDIETAGWPACGEIDMMEFAGKDPNLLHTTLHTPASHGQSVNTAVNTVPNISDDFHVFKMNWTEEHIEFFIDDQLLYRFQPEIRNKKTYPFDHPFYLIINTAVGGSFGGSKVDNSIFPQELWIDYIKIYKPQ